MSISSFENGSVIHYQGGDAAYDSGYESSNSQIQDIAVESPGEWAEAPLAALKPEVALPSDGDIFYDEEQKRSSKGALEEFVEMLSYRRWPLGIYTMPRFNAKSNLSKLRPRPSLKACYSGSSGRSTGSLRSPDRFLPVLGSPDQSTEKFHMSKDSNKLSPSEKLLRNDSASIDAFSPRRNFTSPSPVAVSSSNQSNTRGNRPGGTILRFSGTWQEADSVQTQALFRFAEIPPPLPVIGR
jgi:hypothetical protein